MVSNNSYISLVSTPIEGVKTLIVAVIGGYDVTLGVFIRGRKNDRGLKRRNDLFPKYLCWTPIGPLLGDVIVSDRGLPLPLQWLR